MKNINQEDFFKQVSINSGGTDLETVRNVYYGIVKTISKELKSSHGVKMPDWGEFKLKIHKSRRSPDVNDGVIRILPPKPVIKFVPDYKVKRYFYSLWDEGTML